ncbi:MAG: sugar phosphate isomerase/epimerase family protein [Actinomycetota bacterium]
MSFGVFELTIGKLPNLPRSEEILDAAASAGYEGIDLGPVGYLGNQDQLRVRLESRGLGLAGGWVQMRFSEREGFEKDLTDLDQTLDLFAAVADVSVEPPKPTLADAGSPARAANPGRGKDLPEIGLDAAGWTRLGEGVKRAAERCRDRGFEPTFHHHACTHVEAPHEIERLLELTDIGLCLDTGHLLLGGGDPLRALGDWGARINHLHVKDVRVEVLQKVIADRAGMEAVWSWGTFCELGTGDVDIEGFLSLVKGSGFSGWLVVEQDRIPGPEEPVSDAREAQARNRRFLEARGV